MERFAEHVYFGIKYIKVHKLNEFFLVAASVIMK